MLRKLSDKQGNYVTYDSGQECFRQEEITFDNDVILELRNVMVKSYI